MFLTKFSSTQKILWFHIGSVESLENKVEEIEHDLFIDAANQIEIVYVNQFDLDKMSNFLPTLFIVGLSLYFMKRGNALGAFGKSRMFGNLPSIVRHVKPGDITIRFKYDISRHLCVCVCVCSDYYYL